MAPSSSSAASSQLQKKYGVFISFRGEDTRFNFTSHLHIALRRHKIETFMDDGIEKGEEVWRSLEEAIENSILFIVVLSENYASSIWCLRELAKILKCTKDEGKEKCVIPVFYKVEPSDVGHQFGSYQKAFKKHERNIKVNKQQLLQWREDLTHTSKLAGWTCSVKRNEAELIGEIVKCVVRKLDSMYQRGGYFKNLIGIHEKIATIELLMRKGSPQEVQVIGIWGMGGIGKTTLARAVYDKLHFQYEGCCFLENVSEKSKNGIIALREELISTLLGDESHIDKHCGITPSNMNRLSQTRSLIVLDDVDDQEHVENLVGRHDFGAGSKILITTRDKQVLGKKADVYEVETLNFGEAFHLFSLKAFKNDSADQMLNELAQDVVSYAQGNPLALTVLGSLLCGKSKNEWESQLEKLRKMPPSRIQKALKLSFQGLDHEEKIIFLIVACLFHGAKVEEIQDLLDTCHYSTIIGLKRLEEKSLLSIRDDSISMHDLIKEMGREIVREESLRDPKKQSYLWDINDIVQILNHDNMGNEAIEGITLKAREIKGAHLSPEAFLSMPNLKFLNIRFSHGQKIRFPPFDFWKEENLQICEEEHLQIPYGLEFSPNKLKLLCWEECPLKSLPAAFSAENLVTIEMPESNLTKLWYGIQNLVNLKKIDLFASKNLIELPNLSKAIHLTEVDLSYCSKLSSVHPSILSLHSLHRLSLQYCKALTSITSNIHLKSLCLLNLKGCSRLRQLSVTSESCQFELNLSETAFDDIEFSSSSGHLSKINILHLKDCRRVTNLPDKLVELSNLQHLSIKNCRLALNLDFIFDRLHALKRLKMDRCGLDELPASISLLSSLRELSLTDSYVETLPTSIKHLSNLHSLRLNGCWKLRSVPELPSSILRLCASDCTSLESLHITPTTAVILGEEEKELAPLYDFEGCNKLDEQSFKAVEAKALLDMNKGIYSEVCLKYPGRRVPDWFMYRSTQSSIAINLLSIPKPWDWSFIFGVVVSYVPDLTEIDFGWFINGRNVHNYDNCPIVLSWGMTSAHVCLWYVSYLPPRLRRIVENMETNYQSSIYPPLVEMKFRVCTHHFPESEREFETDYDSLVVIKEWGVCPTSAPEYQNYIKGMELALQPHPNSTGMEFGCSYHNTYHKEAVPRNSKDFIFPTPPPSGTWKTPTQGLKDIFFL